MASNRQLLFCNEIMVFEASLCDAVANSVWSWTGETTKCLYVSLLHGGIWFPRSIGTEWK